MSSAGNILTSGLFGGDSKKYVDIATVSAIKPTCGVKPHLFKVYDFDDHIWKNPIGLLPPHYYSVYHSLFDSLLSVSHKIVYIKKCYWIKIPSIGWIPKDNVTLAMKDSINIFYGQNFYGTKFDEELADTFFKGTITLQDPNDPDESDTFSIGSCPQLDDIICIPHGPEFVQTKNGRFLNIWTDQQMRGDVAYAKYGREFLWLMYRSLCNGKMLDPDEKTEKDMIAQEVLGGTFCGDHNFKKLCMFCAALVQYPGINMLINIFLVGELQGIGKGTLLEILSLIIGGNMMGKLLQSDVEAGWTDHLMNKILIEVDELDPDAGFKGKVFWNKWFKRETIVDVASFRERNKGEHRPINIANYLVTSNNEAPIAIEKTDRRNQFIKTTDNPMFVYKASAFQEVLYKPYADRCASGLAAYFERIKVDKNYINTVFSNDIKHKTMEATRNVVEEWLLEDETLEYDKDYESTSLFTEKFKKWVKIYAPNKENIEITQNAFGRSMNSADRMQELSVFKYRDSKTSRYMYRISEKKATAAQQAVDLRSNEIEALAKDFDYSMVVDREDSNFHQVVTKDKKSLNAIRAKIRAQPDDF